MEYILLSVICGSLLISFRKQLITATVVLVFVLYVILPKMNFVHLDAEIILEVYVAISLFSSISLSYILKKHHK
jgi:hypothetical protein